MSRIAGAGLAATPPDGWEGEIYSRDPVPPTLGRAGGVETPIIHLANFALPPVRGDFGGGAVETMDRNNVFVALLEHDPAEASTALFSHRGVPWPLTIDDFRPEQMQRTLPGQSGCQRFFTVGGRAFCLYVAVGSHRLRALYLSEINAALASIEIS